MKLCEAKTGAVQLMLIGISFGATIYIHNKHAWGGNQIEQAAGGLIFLICMYVVLTPYNTLAKRKKIAVISLYIISFGLALNSMERNNLWFIKDSKELTRSVKESVGAMFNLAYHGLDDYSQGYEYMLSRVNSLNSIPKYVSGTVDVYPDNAGIVVARKDLIYRPRPAFLSLNAHTEKLARNNAAFLKTDRAPDWILFEMVPIAEAVHNRYPTTVDGPSWPELMSRYSLYGMNENFITLAQLENPRPYNLTLLEESEINLEEQVSILNEIDNLIWVEIDVRKSLLGKITAFFFKSPPVKIVVDRKSGISSGYKLVPELGRAGFLLNPFIENNDGFALLHMQSGGVTDANILDKVTSFSVHIEGNYNTMYTNEVLVRVYRMDYTEDEKYQSNVDYSTVLARYQHTQKLNLLMNNVKNCQFPPSAIHIDTTEKPVLLTHALCEIRVPIPQEARLAEVQYGMRKTSYTSTNGQTDGATFQVVHVQEDGTLSELMLEYLDPTNNADARLLHKKAFNLPIGGGELILKTMPGNAGDFSYDHTYWADLDFE